MLARKIIIGSTRDGRAADLVRAAGERPPGSRRLRAAMAAQAMEKK